MKKDALITNLRKRGFTHNILQAFRDVDRTLFVDSQHKEYAYWDNALPIEEGQFISQPYTIAFMLDLLNLQDGDRILEIGSGSGYVLALLAQICPNSTIYGIERIKKLKELSEQRLEQQENITVFHGDGNVGYQTGAPFDKILISATETGVPRKLLEQLGEEGVMVLPIGSSIFRIRKDEGNLHKEEFEGFSFVELKEGKK